VTEEIRHTVRARARDRCEYCRIRQQDVPFLRHQIEHVIARQHGGNDSPGNLALACYRCNKFKGPNLTAFDPKTGKLVRLFNPRRQRWSEHFAIRNKRVIGITPRGRATVELLQINARKRRLLREELEG
jgi:hypothetical protein